MNTRKLRFLQNAVRGLDFSADVIRSLGVALSEFETVQKEVEGLRAENNMLRVFIESLKVCAECGSDAGIVWDSFEKMFICDNCGAMVKGPLV